MLDITLVSGIIPTIGLILLSINDNKLNRLYNPYTIILGVIMSELTLFLFWVNRIDLFSMIHPTLALPYVLGGAISLFLYWRSGWPLIGALGATVLILHAGLTLWEYPIQIPVRSPFMLLANLSTFLCLYISIPLKKIGENKLKYSFLLIPPIVASIAFLAMPPEGALYTSKGSPGGNMYYWMLPIWNNIRLLSVLAVIEIVNTNRGHILFQDRVIMAFKRWLK